jgi:hypothetical protein
MNEARNVARRRWIALSTAMGVALGAVSAAFVIAAVTSRWSEVRDEVAHARPGWLVGGLVLATAAMVWIARCWARALTLVGEREAATPRRVVAWYFAGEIGKYLPGGVWTVVGRGELARRGGVATGRAYPSVGLSLIALYLAGLALTAVLVPLAVLTGAPASLALALLALLPLGFAVLHPRVLARLRALVVRVTGRGQAIVLPPLRATIGLVVRYVPAWLLIWGATWCVARALLPDPPILRLGVAATLSWVAGLAAVPVPAGAGVREATFVGLAGLSVGLAVTIAITSRLLFVVVDALGALVATSWAVGNTARARSNATAP